MPVKTQSESGEKGKPQERRPFFELSRRVLLAGVGAMALAQDEIEAFVDKLVERGEIAEKDGRKLVKELAEKRKKRMAEAEDEVGRRVSVALEKLNVPTKADIESLNEKLAALAKKLDELKKS